MRLRGPHTVVAVVDENRLRHREEAQGRVPLLATNTRGSVSAGPRRGANTRGFREPRWSFYWRRQYHVQSDCSQYCSAGVRFDEQYQKRIWCYGAGQQYVPRTRSSTLPSSQQPQHTHTLPHDPTRSLNTHASSQPHPRSGSLSSFPSPRNRCSTSQTMLASPRVSVRPPSNSAQPCASLSRQTYHPRTMIPITRACASFKLARARVPVRARTCFSHLVLPSRMHPRACFSACCSMRSACCVRASSRPFSTGKTCAERERVSTCCCCSCCCCSCCLWLCCAAFACFCCCSALLLCCSAALLAALALALCAIADSAV